MGGGWGRWGGLLWWVLCCEWWRVWLLLLSGHQPREEHEGECGEGRASTRRPARTRHCVGAGTRGGSLERGLQKAARAREMKHPRAVMGVSE